MIKHGKIHQVVEPHTPHSHLDPIKEFVTKGIADAKEALVLEPMACDIKGAKRFNGQQCVIAKALTRTLKPQAVAVGRSLAFVVIDGLALRFALPTASRKAVEEFDERGRVKRAPIELRPVCRSQKLRVKRAPRPRPENALRHADKPRRSRKFGVRAVGGGIVA